MSYNSVNSTRFPCLESLVSTMAEWSFYRISLGAGLYQGLVRASDLSPTFSHVWKSQESQFLKVLFLQRSKKPLFPYKRPFLTFPIVSLGGFFSGFEVDFDPKGTKWKALMELGSWLSSLQFLEASCSLQSKFTSDSSRSSWRSWNLNWVCVFLFFFFFSLMNWAWNFRNEIFV